MVAVHQVDNQFLLTMPQLKKANISPSLPDHISGTEHVKPIRGGAKVQQRASKAMIVCHAPGAN